MRRARDRMQSRRGTAGRIHLSSDAQGADFRNFGHLENTQAAMLLKQIETRRLRHVIAAHLSEQNNRPDLARDALASALNCAPDWIGVATQENGFGWRGLA